jgi:type IV secretory pathway TraG/TraD family ATPase VirD4
MSSRPDAADGLDQGTTALLAVVIGVFGLALTLWAGGEAASTLTGYGVAHSDLAAGLRVLTHPGQPSRAWRAPMPGPIAYWTISAATTVLAATAVGWIARWWRRDTSSRRTDPHHAPGLAERHEIAAHASRKALLRRASTVRPSLTNPQPCDAGYQLGRAHNVPTWASVEDSMVLLGPPRSGKGLHLVIPMIVDSPGAVITTATRPDNLTVTLTARARRGPVAVFDPQGLAGGVASATKWSPIRGCDDPQTAMIRARALAAGTSEHVENNRFWQAQTEAALRAFLQAAAIDGRGPADLYRWSLDPVAATEATRILHAANHAAALGWADALDSIINGDPRTRDNTWAGVRVALSPLADPHVLNAVSPRASEHFDPATFLTDNGTLYLLGTATGAGSTAGLVAAFIEDVVEVARHSAAASAGARLDPPLALLLDEAANYVLPSLPSLMSEGGGTGITTVAVLQSLAQARARWGEHEAAAIWDAAIVKVILGGGSNAKDLHDLSALIGERDEETTSNSRDHRGRRSTSTALRRVPILDVGRLRTLPFGTGVLMLRAARPILLDLTAWPDRTDASQLGVDRDALEKSIQAAAGAGPAHRGLRRDYPVGTQSPA